MHMVQKIKSKSAAALYIYCYKYIDQERVYGMDPFKLVLPFVTFVMMHFSKHCTLSAHTNRFDRCLFKAFKG